MGREGGGPRRSFFSTPRKGLIGVSRVEECEKSTSCTPQASFSMPGSEDRYRCEHLARINVRNRGQCTDLARTFIPMLNQTPYFFEKPDRTLTPPRKVARKKAPLATVRFTSRKLALSSKCSNRKTAKITPQ